MSVESEFKEALSQTTDEGGGIDWQRLWVLLGPILQLLLDLLDKQLSKEPSELEESSTRAATLCVQSTVETLKARVAVAKEEQQ